jgi:hypothetical protein
MKQIGVGAAGRSCRRGRSAGHLHLCAGILETRQIAIWTSGSKTAP